MDPRQAEGKHILGQSVIDLPPQPDKVRAAVESVFQLCGCHADQAGQTSPFWRLCLEVLRDRPQRRRRNAGRHQLTIPVEDAATAGRQIQRAGVADLALLLIEIRADRLHINRTAQQHQKSQSDHRHQQLGARGRRARREQWAARVVQATRTGGRPRRGTLWTAAAAHGRPCEAVGAADTTTCFMMAEVAGTMRNLSRAVLSMRAGVA